MFENIGGKIKTLAKVLCWFGIIASVILAIIMFSSIESANHSEEGLYRTLGFIFLIIGPLLSWVSSFFFYGFGELIETNCEIAKNTRHSSSNSPIYHNVNSDKTFSNDSVHSWLGNCEMCNKRDVRVSAVKIVDDMGTRHRNVCEECTKKYNCVADRDKELDDLLKNGLITQEEYEAKKAGK